MYYCYLDTPIGDLLLAGDENELSLIGFPKGAMRHDPEPDWIYKEKPFEEARRQLTEYFAGERKEFDLPLKLSGTEFQVEVLQELLKIPYGETASYSEIANRIVASVARMRCVPWVRRMAATRFRSSFPATA
jgi:methylated-DNA-[protein]-cysteine S-methyltransferase